MSRVRALLFSGALLVAAMPVLAQAEQIPTSGSYDSRMRYVAYNPGQVVHLSTIVGATLVVSFGATETVVAV
ncbi:MAG: type IV secretion system protein VirB9, partial [Acidocella sp. 35-58-6]